MGGRFTVTRMLKFLAGLAALAFGGAVNFAMVEAGTYTELAGAAVTITAVAAAMVVWHRLDCREKARNERS